MKFVGKVGQAFCRVLVDYCNNSSLAGIRNIGNRRLHWTERGFWVGCTLIGWFFAVQLIRTYVVLFRNDTVNIALENVDTRWERTAFPAVGVCEMGYTKEVYDRLEAYMESLREGESMEYNYDVEDYLLRMTYHNLYNKGAMQVYCKPFENCAECMRCPLDGYRAIAEWIRANCTELFSGCQWNGKPFDCCRYFRPIQTSVGSCYVLNSLQTVEKYGKDWLLLEVDKVSPEGVLLLSYNLAASTHIMNEEDIPHILLTSLAFSQISPGYSQTIFMTLQDIVNDPLVRSVDIDVRRCRFPDENFRKNGYPQYSYSVCVTECLKAAQIRLCNCTHHNNLLEESDLACGYKGIQCLDERSLIAPATKMLQPWRTDGLVCHCHPSCNEKQIHIVGKESEMLDHHQRSVAIKLMGIPTQRYRRQIVREDIDVVVSIGGILGLFTGASLLSMAEFCYFFTARFIYNIVADDADDDTKEEDEKNDMSDGGRYSTDSSLSFSDGSLANDHEEEQDEYRYNV
uniref:Pickpocket n=1 Tax=Anopheles atroparvus TaxID=41427 RepID=A0A182J1K5_ANOAO